MHRKEYWMYLSIERIIDIRIDNGYMRKHDKSKVPLLDLNFKQFPLIIAVTPQTHKPQISIEIELTGFQQHKELIDKYNCIEKKPVLYNNNVIILIII